MRNSVVLFLLSLFLIGAGDTTKPFYWLKELVVMEETHLGTARIFYNPNISTLIQKKIPRDPEPDFIHVLETRIDSNKDQKFQVIFTNGFSADPTFIITDKQFNGFVKGMFAKGGLTLVLPGNGYIYISGHANSFFDDRRKYTYRNGLFFKIKQPYKYVGLKTTVKQDMAIYSDKSMTDVVARLTKGSTIEVLINDGDYYLIKTAFGLVGWHKHENLEQFSPYIEGLYFHGD